MNLRCTSIDNLDIGFIGSSFTEEELPEDGHRTDRITQAYFDLHRYE